MNLSEMSVAELHLAIKTAKLDKAARDAEQLAIKIL